MGAGGSVRSQSLTPVVPVTTKKLKTKGKRLEKMMKKMNDRISKNQATWICFWFLLVIFEGFDPMVDSSPFFKNPFKG